MLRKNRDIARSGDINQIVSSINGYITNNNGALPTKLSDIANNDNNLGRSFILLHYSTSAINGTTTGAETKSTVAGDFSWKNLFGVSTDVQQVDVDVDSIIIVAEAKCEADDRVAPGSLRQMVIVYKLEDGESIYCRGI